MSSILNSISSGDLQVQEAPREAPVKDDSIASLLINSEIELDTCNQQESSNLKNFNTGFGGGNELHFELPCKKPSIRQPLYVSNYLHEFVTEEEKAAARHALGLYNKHDVVAMSLLTTSDPGNNLHFGDLWVQQMEKGGKPFLPITSIKAVFDGQGKTLDVCLDSIKDTLRVYKNTLSSITNRSNSSTISSLGDVQSFLKGFKNGDDLKDVVDNIKQEMITFELI